jgi:undecaprenyl pyrophosphate phosphatase UppP
MLALLIAVLVYYRKDIYRLLFIRRKTEEVRQDVES